MITWRPDEEGAYVGCELPDAVGCSGWGVDDLEYAIFDVVPELLSFDGGFKFNDEFKPLYL